MTLITQKRFDVNPDLIAVNADRAAGAMAAYASVVKHHSPFRQCAQDAIESGWSPLPRRDKPARGLPAKDAKRPAIDGWQQYCERAMTHDELVHHYRKLPRAHISVAAGYANVVWLDHDTDNEEIKAAVRSVIPESIVARIGSKGFAEPFRVIGRMPANKKFYGPNNRTILEILSVGSNVCIPPSIHPETGKPYEWLTERTVYDTIAEELPEITADQLDQLAEALKPWLRKEKVAAPSKKLATIDPADLSDEQRKCLQGWADADLDKQISKLANASKGRRNNTLYAVVCALGKWVHHGFLPQQTVEDAAYAMAHTLKLVRDNGAKDVRDTIADGLARSADDPLPEPKVRRQSSKTPASKPIHNKPIAKPIINIEPGKLHDMATAAEKAILAAGIPFFTRGDGIFRPIVQSLVDSAGRVTKSAALVKVDKVFMRDTMCAVIDWKRWNKDEKEWVPANAPDEVAAIIMGRVGLWSFPPIGGVISTPSLRVDGSIISEAGYDKATCLYVQDPVALPAMPTKPTRKDAEASLKLLQGLLDEFPFVDEASRSVALSALMTPVVRGAMDVAPAHVTRAPTAGTGKSFLFDIAAAIAIGHACPVMAAGKTEEETEKRIGAKALAGHPIINIDNVNGELGGDTLCQMISQAICEIRVLGLSEMPRVVNRFCVFATGNNIRLVGDMTRRTLLCSMDARMEKPAEREFKGDPVARVLANRGQYIAACLTIVRAYFAAGKPKVAKVPMNSFGDWSGSVRSALIWLGCADPVETIQKARDEDPELQQLAQFIEAMKSLPADRLPNGSTRAIPRAVADLIGLAQREAYVDGTKGMEHQELHDVMLNFYHGGKFNSRSLGKWLASSKQRIVDGCRLNSLENPNKKVQQWFVEQI